MRYILNSRVPRRSGRKQSLLAGFAALAFGVSVALAGGGVNAAPNYTLFGEATVVTGGNPDHAAQLVSDAAPGWGGVDVVIPSGLTFADLTTLSANFNVTDDNCGAGSPRFQVEVDDGTATTKTYTSI